MKHRVLEIDHETVSATTYDVVVIGSGISGAIMAKELGEKGYSVLVLEAGAGSDLSMRGYEQYVSTFYSSVSKDNNAPFPVNVNAPMPRSPETRRVQPGGPDATSGFFVQNGPYALDSVYAKIVGGTTMHWQATTPRMLPDDFALRTRFGHGIDWPIGYDELEPYYRKAEFEIGVAADLEDEASHGAPFPPGYVFPMRALPPSYLDQLVAKGINGLPIELDGETLSLRVRTLPQGRNSIPNPAYDGGKGYKPVGAVSPHPTMQGQRCQGNNNCTPICPAQAKYDARKTLAKALDTGRVHLLPQSVASRVVIDPDNGRVTGIEYKHYEDPTGGAFTGGVARGRIFVLAGNAVENPRLMLASDLRASSDLMGRHLMDHPYLLSWGLLPEVAGTMRGTQSTSGIATLRNGAFRRRQAGFAVDIHNDGWGWATGSPYSDLNELVDSGNKFGSDLRRALVDRISRQLLLASMVEIMPERANRVTVDPAYKDRLGNPRPVVSFGIPDYTLEGIAYARQLSARIFQRLGAEDHTSYDPSHYGYLSYQGEGYVALGGNHFAGTHMMGSSPKNSVVNDRQQSWDHANLYLVGPGSMVTIGTSNTTLTAAALCFRSVEHILDTLGKEHAVSVAAQ